MTTIATTSSTSPLDQDLALLQGLLNDDQAAWKRFHREYYPLSCQCIARILKPFRGVVSPDDVSEIYANLSLQLLVNDKHKLRRFDPERGTRLKGWIALLATRATYDFLRLKRRTVVEAEFSAQIEINSEDDPLHNCLMSERTEILSAIVTEFSNRDREFMQLYFEQGLSADEVALRLGISVKTVYSKKHKIQDRLLGLLERRKLAA